MANFSNSYISPGKVITVTAPYTVTSGMLVLVGSIVGMATADAASGANVELQVGPFVATVNKTSALAINEGDLLYLDDTNHVVNKTSASQKLVGVALAPGAANPSASVKMRFNGGYTT